MPGVVYVNGKRFDQSRFMLMNYFVNLKIIISNYTIVLTRFLMKRRISYEM
jgi:hypothetical protein